MTMLFTWRDVQRTLSAGGPWLSADVDLFTVALVVPLDGTSAAMAELRKLFGPSFVDGKNIILESPIRGRRSLRVVLEEDDIVPQLRNPKPLWATSDALVSPLVQGPGTPAIAAFYSYKGGVGRTTTLLAVLASLLERSQENVLLVDADMEAPGLSLDFASSEEAFSFYDLASLIQDAESDPDLEEVFQCAAHYIARAPVTLDLSFGRRSFYFLPAFRLVHQIFAPPVSLESVVRGVGRSFIIADALAKVSRMLGVTTVLCDLRAGVSEVSSPFLLDGRILKVFVSSCAHASFEGTINVLKRLRQTTVAAREPIAVLSMIPSQSAQEETSQKVAAFQAELGYAAEGDVIDATSRPNVHEVSFSTELLIARTASTAFFEALPGTKLGKEVAPAIADAIQGPGNVSNDGGSGRALDNVIAVLKKLEYAEQNSEPGLLATPPLMALCHRFSIANPVTVVVGSKGSGKTFAWGQMVLLREWYRFVSAVLTQGNPAQLSIVDTLQSPQVFPLLAPQNVGDELRGQLADATASVRRSLGVDPSMNVTPLRDQIRDRKLPAAQLWVSFVVRQLGLPDTCDTIQGVVEHLSKKEVRLCLALDGLEEVFQPEASGGLDAGEREFLRYLLQDFVQEIKVYGREWLGIVVFIRRDLAQHAIPQNFGQFLSLYEDYVLAWDSTEALRFVVWMLSRADYLSLDDSAIRCASYEDLRDWLVPFWGKRLGTERSNEAHTDRWVIAALSDFQGRLQARDLVRLVRYAVQSTLAQSGGEMLSPKSIRQAVPECSRRKIDELQDEIPSLRPTLDKLRNLPEGQRQVPFLATDVNLSLEEVSFLSSHGLILAKEDELYLPEIARHGLGFRLDGGRRAKVLALYREANRRRSV